MNNLDILQTNPKDLIDKDYIDVITLIYESIPEQEVDTTNKEEINKNLVTYAKLHSYLSYVHAVILDDYNGQKYNKYKILKQSVDQAISVVKFQYDILSRRYTVNKDESKNWNNIN